MSWGADISADSKKPGLTMVMRLMDGAFPEYGRVIPKEGEKQVVVSRTRLLEGLKRISLLSGEKSSAERVQFSQALLRITQLSYSGGELSVGFNARYLVDVLGVMDCEEVVLELGDEHSPGVLHALGVRTCTAVVMPMRV